MMEVTVTTTSKVAVKYLRAECGVRYWEDASVNGVEDGDGTLIPFRTGDTWGPLIDLDTGTVVNWPEGTTANIHYKVADAGRYWLLDIDQKPVVKIDGYVPSIMSPKEDGYGDYVIMEIGADGKIGNWRADLSAFQLSEAA